MSDLPLSNFKVNSPETLMIYVSALIFILSFIIDVKVNNINALRAKAGMVLGLGILVWFITRSIFVHIAFFNEDRVGYADKVKPYYTAAQVLKYVYWALAVIITSFP